MTSQKNAPMDLQAKIAPRKATAAAFMGIPITIRNASSVGFRGAEVAVKDNDTEEVAEAHFGRIESHTTATRTVRLPTGAEFCAFKVFPDVGDTVFGAGAADNAPAINITISDG